MYIVQRQETDTNREFQVSMNLPRRTARYAEELCELALRLASFALRDVCHNARSSRTQLGSEFVSLTRWQLVREAIGLSAQRIRFLPDGQLVVRLPEGSRDHSRILGTEAVICVISSLRNVPFSRTPLASGLWLLAHQV